MYYYNMNWLYTSIMFLKEVKCVLKIVHPAILLYLILKSMDFIFFFKVHIETHPAQTRLLSDNHHKGSHFSLTQKGRIIFFPSAIGTISNLSPGTS